MQVIFVENVDVENIRAPSCCAIPDCVGGKPFLYRIRLLFTLHHCNPVRAAERKSALRFVGDTKSNLVCAVPEKAKCK